MRPDALLLASAVGMVLALGLMVVALCFPSPRTIGAFLGLALPVALVSVVAFVLYVLRDLRRRRAL